MSKPIARVKYLGTALPVGATTVSLYDSTLNDADRAAVDLGAGKLNSAGERWFVYSVFHDQTATVNGFFKCKKADGTLSAWRQFYTLALIPGALSSVDEVFIEPYQHVKFEWVNGGITQTIFDENLILSDQRSKAT
jgi:hypothetical protein